jgi:hypothetical protein
VLSRAPATNSVLVCLSVSHGSHARVDPYTCGVECDDGFRLEDGAFVSECAGLVSACMVGTYEAESCAEGLRTLYIRKKQPKFSYPKRYEIDP